MKRTSPFLAIMASTVMAATAQAGSNAVKIGVLNDQAGMASDLGGPGTVTAVKLAIEDFGRTVLGKPIELVVADHQNKADVSAQISATWYDRDGVDMIVDLPNSSATLAAMAMADARKKVAISLSGLSSTIAGAKCIDTGFQFMTDSYSIARALAKSIVENGGKDWFFITADYAFGHALEQDASEVIKQEGGTVKGRVLHPFNVSDFASYLLRAQSSGAKVVGVANGGGDTINSLKQATEFGLPQQGLQMAAFLIYISDIHALGLPVAKGTRFADTFYWDMDDASRAWSKRFMAAAAGRAPTQVHAAAYSAVTHYLKAVKSAGTDDGTTVARKMRELPVEDFFTHSAPVRPDGRVVRDHFLWEVKAPAESRYPYDYVRLVAKIPGDELVRPIAQSDCPLVKAR